jgi:hypothetical protein
MTGSNSDTVQSVVHRTDVPIGAPMGIERATVAISDKPKVQETDWMAFNGYQAKFRRVPAFAYAKARQHLRRIMRDNKPIPPTVQRGTRSMVNKNDPYYLDQVSLWDSEWEDLQRDIVTTTSILVGIVLKDPVPPDEVWVDFVFDILGALSIDLEAIFTSFKYNEDKMRELLFKEYVILSNPDDMERFNAFQGGEDITEGAETDGEDEYTEAVDMFRPEQGREAAL